MNDCLISAALYQYTGRSLLMISSYIMSGKLTLIPSELYPAKAVLCLDSPKAGWGSFILGNLTDIILIVRLAPQQYSLLKKR